MDGDFIKYRKRISEILPSADLETLTAKKLRRQLEHEFNVDLQAVKKDVDAIIIQELDKLSTETAAIENKVKPLIKKEPVTQSQPIAKITQSQNRLSTPSPPKKPIVKRERSGQKLSNATVQDDSDIEDDGVEPSDYDLALKLDKQMNRRPSRSTAAQPKKAKRKLKTYDNEGEPAKKRNTGLMKPLVLSAALSALMGGETSLSRPEVVKRIWAYIKQHGLQDPSDKRMIICDDLLKPVMENKARVGAFEMNKYISHHVANPDELVGGEETKSQVMPKKKRPVTANGVKKSAGFNAPVQLSPALGKVVGGATEMPRSEVVKEIWKYIRAHNLQNPADKREIICDELMQGVMGRKRVNMFGMNKLMSAHMFKLDEKSNVTVKHETNVKVKSEGDDVHVSENLDQGWSSQLSSKESDNDLMDKETIESHE